MLLATVKSAHEPDYFVVFVEMHYGAGKEWGGEVVPSSLRNFIASHEKERW